MIADAAAPDGEDPIMVSAIEHYAYCARQCALIHVDQTFDENVYTLRGTQAHERVDVPAFDLTAGVRHERALPIWSDRLGLTGRADLVEFRPQGPFPVEYKVGRRRPRRGGPSPEDLQVCAQGMCLEEMLGAPCRRARSSTGPPGAATASCSPLNCAPPSRRRSRASASSCARNGCPTRRTISAAGYAR